MNEPYPAGLRPLFFVGASRKDLLRMPEEVKDVFGAALLDAQYGDDPAGSRLFGEGLPHSVRKLVDDHAGDTYRVAYTAFRDAVYVLHVFRKKSISGRATPQRDRELIEKRLSDAAEHYREHFMRG